MNIFQKQLVVDGKSLAELPNLDGYVWENKVTPPSKVSVEEFEKDMTKINKRKTKKTRKSHE